MAGGSVDMTSTPVASTPPHELHGYGLCAVSSVLTMGDGGCCGWSGVVVRVIVVVGDGD